ncbi:MAG: hypothetical protein AAF843_00590 [Bacteroidota bacterium]
MDKVKEDIQDKLTYTLGCITRNQSRILSLNPLKGTFLHPFRVLSVKGFPPLPLTPKGAIHRAVGLPFRGLRGEQGQKTLNLTAHVSWLSGEGSEYNQFDFDQNRIKP